MLGAAVPVFERSWQDGSSDSPHVAVIGTATASQHCEVRACLQQALVVARQLVRIADVEFAGLVQFGMAPAGGVRSYPS